MAAYKPATESEIANAVIAVAALSVDESAALNDVTAGTVSASKAVIVDANKDIGDFRDVGLARNLEFNGAMGANTITLPDNLADALSILIAAGADLLVFDTRDASEKLSILSAITQKLGFYGVTPVVQAAAYTQTYATADKTHANPTASTVVTTAAGLASYGYAEAQANALIVAVNALVADVADVKQLVNSVIDDLQALGLVG